MDDDTLKNIEAESAEQASIEASEGAADVYDTAADDEVSESAAADTSAAADASQESVEGTD